MKNNDNLQSYTVEKRIGEGAFATVYLAAVQETGDKVAIKKAPIDKKYKNRELANLKLLGDHPNIIALKDAFYVVGQNEEVYINYVMEYMPENLSDYLRNQKKQKQYLNKIQLQIITYQLLRGLAFILSIQLTFLNNLYLFLSKFKKNKYIFIQKYNNNNCLIQYLLLINQNQFIYKEYMEKGWHIEIQNLKTYQLKEQLLNIVILDLQKSFQEDKLILPIYVQDIIEHLN